jgi:hypothetical protein
MMKQKHRMSADDIVILIVESAIEDEIARLTAIRDSLQNPELQVPYDLEIAFYKLFFGVYEGRKLSEDEIAKELKYNRRTMKRWLTEPLKERIVDAAKVLLCDKQPDNVSPILAARLRLLNIESADKDVK